MTRYTKEEIKRLPLNKETVHLYGREQQVNYRTAVAKARFLNGQSVCFVWCEFEDSKGKKRPRLLLSTDMQLSGLAIKCPDPVLRLIDNTPWRKNTPITAGRIRMGLIRYFSQVRVRDWWDGKSQKFQPPDTDILRRFEDLL